MSNWMKQGITFAVLAVCLFVAFMFGRMWGSADTLGGYIGGKPVIPGATYAGDIDMGNNIISNIGSASTDFTAGGLTAPYLTATVGMRVNGTSDSGILVVSNTSSSGRGADIFLSSRLDWMRFYSTNVSASLSALLGTFYNLDGVNFYAIPTADFIVRSGGNNTLDVGSTGITVNGTLNATGDLAAAGGRTAVYGFYGVPGQGNTNVPYLRNRSNAVTVTMPSAGSILYNTATLRYPVVTGTVWVTPTINTVASGPALSITVGQIAAYATAAKDTRTFAAGGAIGLLQTTTTDFFAGDSGDLTVDLTVEY